jgi:hypothetical protein
MSRPPVRRAVKAFEDFSGHRPAKVRTAKLDDRDVTGWQMGPMVGIAYEAKRDGETQRYFHEFKKSARPNLVARDDGKKLYIDGGSYTVTERGIEDMPQLFVVNPSPRKGRSKRKAPMARRRRTATRRRATRQVAVFRANPTRRRRRRTTSVARRSYRRNPIRRAVRRTRRRVTRSYRRNPSARRVGAAMGGFGKMLLPAAGIGLGAVGTEVIMGYLPIPANFKTGVMRHVTKGVVGIAAGMLIGKVLRQKRLGNFFALGAVAIAVHDATKEFIASSMPSIAMGQYRPAIRGSLGGMGYANPAQIGYMPSIASSLGGAATQHGTGGETAFAV